MYGYQDDKRILPAQVLQKITQEQIFEYILHLPINTAERYLSPFRADRKPGCRFQEREDGTLMFIDFGDKGKRTHRNCFMMVMDTYNISLDLAIDKILFDFSLSISQADYTPVTQSTEETVKTPIVITYHAIPYERRDVRYWAQFFIKPEHLLEDRVYAIDSFTKIKEGKARTVRIYAISYAIDFISRVKIYQPTSPKYKWITNCDENFIGNFDNLPPTGKHLLIKKSYKDHRVMRNLNMGLNVIWFQNEGSIPDLWILKNLTERFEVIIVFYDNDEAGIMAAIRLVNIFNSLKKNCAVMVHLPIRVDRRMEWKDPSKFISKEGKQDLITVFKTMLEWQSIKLH